MTTLRPATVADAPMLRSWDQEPHVRESKGDDDWGWERELGRVLDWRAQLIAEVDGRPVGYVEIIDPARDPEHYWGDMPSGLRAIDIWIGDPAYLGRGAGTTMMQLAIARCFDDAGVEAIVIDPLVSNTRAHRFYQRLGFRPVDRRLFGDDDCLVHRLDRTVWARLNIET
jgi:aminoglycoside 6'-N-acetyltransferase